MYGAIDDLYRENAHFSKLKLFYFSGDVHLDNHALIACSLLQGYGSGGYALRIEGLKKVSLWS